MMDHSTLRLTAWLLLIAGLLSSAAIQTRAVQKDDLLTSVDGQGVWCRNSDTGEWTQLATSASQITAGDLDGDGIDDLIGIWPGLGGAWVKYSSNSTWERLANSADLIASGDMNGDQRDDLVVSETGGVYYRCSVSSSWIKMASTADRIATGDLDGDNTDDLLGVWSGQGGVWVKYSQNGSWAKLATSTNLIAAGDMNGDQRDDLVVSEASGVYYRCSVSGSWTKMASEADHIATGDIDGDNIDDLLGIWAGQGGAWVRYSQSGNWEKLADSADLIAAGQMRPARFVISGEVTANGNAIAEALVTFSHDGHSVTTEVNGAYAYWVDKGTSTTVTPFHVNYGHWSPTDRVYTAVDGDRTNHGFAAGCHLDADVDEDGLSDSWEGTWFPGMPLEHVSPSGDLDGDGLNNMGEFIAGSSPDDDTSALRLAITSTDAEPLVSFTARAAEDAWHLGNTRHYTLQRTDSIASGDWTAVPECYRPN